MLQVLSDDDTHNVRMHHVIYMCAARPRAILIINSYSNTYANATFIFVSWDCYILTSLRHNLIQTKPHHYNVVTTIHKIDILEVLHANNTFTPRISLLLYIL